MENRGVTCDVCTCVHNVNCSGCDLNQIHVTEQCTNCSIGVDNPHYCQNYQEKAEM